MLKKLYPCAYAEDVFSIDYQALYNHGYRGILFDVDNTLVHHNEPITPEAEALFAKLAALGLQAALVSNNGQERCQRFAESIHIPFVANADKPQPKGYLQAIAALGLEKEQVLAIGDQMFTDIQGANRAQIHSILVHYMVKNPKAFIGFKRYLEKVILFIYRFKKASQTLDFAIIKE